MDSSIWIAYFRDPGAPASDHLERLMHAEEALVAGPVVYEVLQGTRSHDEFRTFRRILEGLPYLLLSNSSWVAVAGVAAGLRRRGLSLPMTDVLLATLAPSLIPHPSPAPDTRPPTPAYEGGLMSDSSCIPSERVFSEL